MSDIPQVFAPTESVVFRGGTFATKLRIVIKRVDTSDNPMKVKLAIFACYEKGKQLDTYICIRVSASVPACVGVGTRLCVASTPNVAAK